MDNHQQEVADALSADGYLIKSSPRYSTGLGPLTHVEHFQRISPSGNGIAISKTSDCAHFHFTGTKSLQSY
jgi:UDP-N-acetylglucosamine transferase subunit ALG13